MIDQKYLLSAWSIRHYVSKNVWQKKYGHFDIWLLKKPKEFLMQIEVCGKNIQFLNISGNTKEKSH